MKKESLIIYTDGSAYRNLGGYGFIILHKNKKIQGWGSAINTTVNQMEQMAAIMALQTLDCVEGFTCTECGGVREFVKENKFTFSPSCYAECLNSNKDNPPVRLVGVHDCKIISDSKYLVNGMNEHIYKWELDGFNNTANEPIINSYLWYQLSRLSRVFRPDWEWVKGHSGVKYNEEVDELASIGRKNAVSFFDNKIIKGKDYKSETVVFDLLETRYTPYNEIMFNPMSSFIISGQVRTEVIYKKVGVV